MKKCGLLGYGQGVHEFGDLWICVDGCCFLWVDWVWDKV